MHGNNIVIKSNINGMMKRRYICGTKVVSFTISNSITWLNESGVTTAPSSKSGGGKGGQRPSRTQGQNTSGTQDQAPAAQQNQ